jgi:hypothetical protein
MEKGWRSLLSRQVSHLSWRVYGVALYISGYSKVNVTFVGACGVGGISAVGRGRDRKLCLLKLIVVVFSSLPDAMLVSQRTRVSRLETRTKECKTAASRRVF